MGAGYSWGLFYSSTNAPSVYDLQGWSTQAGFSVGPYAVGSVETIKFNSNGQEYRGTSYGGAITSPIPVEGHWTLTYATKIFSFNLFNGLIKLFEP